MIEAQDRRRGRERAAFLGARCPARAPAQGFALRAVGLDDDLSRAPSEKSHFFSGGTKFASQRFDSLWVESNRHPRQLAGTPISDESGRVYSQRGIGVVSRAFALKWKKRARRETNRPAGKYAPEATSVVAQSKKRFALDGVAPSGRMAPRPAGRRAAPLRDIVCGIAP